MISTFINITRLFKIFCIFNQLTWVVTKQEADEGHVKPKTGYQKGHSHIIKDPQELITLLEENNFATIDEIAKKLGRGSPSTIGRILKRLDYVKKKEKNPTKNKTQRR